MARLKRFLSERALSSGARYVKGHFYIPYLLFLSLDVTFFSVLLLHLQAFIIYDTLEAAQTALAKAQNFSFYGKPLQVAFARTPSDISLRKVGQEPEKRPAHPKKGMVAVKLEKASKPAPAAVPVAHPFVPQHIPYGMVPPVCSELLFYFFPKVNG